MKNTIKFRVDVKNLKKERQNHNYRVCRLGKFSDTGTYNPKALKRFLDHMNMTVSEILSYPRFHDAAAFSCAIDANRQGGKDEEYIINGINEQYKNISIKNLTATALRPMKNGKILNKNEMKQYGCTKEDGLKSFDFQLFGNVQGWGTAKVKNGSGGHQDNVTREILEFIDWANKFGEDDKIYVALLDGEHNFSVLKNRKQRDNIWIVDHVGFQEQLNQYE